LEKKEITSDIVPELSERRGRIKGILLDVDGVLTANGVVRTSAGIQRGVFDALDEDGIVQVQRSGVLVGIITGGDSNVVRDRAHFLGIHDIYTGALQKMPAYDEFRTMYNLRDNEVAFMGDSVLDLPVLRQVGFAATPGDGHPSVKLAAHYVARRKGGCGAVREVLDLLMLAREKENSRLSGDPGQSL